MTLKDTILHRWLTIPYVLHTTINHQIVSKKVPTILFIHGLGHSGETWEDVVKQLPGDLRLITIDLLGFGKSPRPLWALYSAKTQARSVIATYLRLLIRGPVIIVGHSLGGLVAVEIAKRYPLFVCSLILCSPPFYKVDEAKRHLLPSSDKLLRDMYQLAKKHPDQFIRMSVLAAKFGLVNKSFNLTRDNADTYMNALEATIINQTSLEDAKRIIIPMHILYGRFDPVVVPRNLRYLAKANENVILTSILASHEIKGPFVKAIASTIISVANKYR